MSSVRMATSRQQIGHRAGSDPVNVLFWLVPRSAPAFKCLGNTVNRYYVGRVRQCGEQAFAITLERASRIMKGSLLTFGRNADIVIEDNPNISSGLPALPILDKILTLTEVSIVKFC